MIKKCLFPVAGYGTRFLPATKSMPKEMLPVVNKPLIQYGVEEASGAGMREICMVTGRGKRAIEDHFDISYELEHQLEGSERERHLDDIRQLQDSCTYTYTRQRMMRGLGDAILTGEVLIGREPFGVLLADDLCVGEGQSVMAQMIEIYSRNQCCVVAVEEVDPAEAYKYGVIAGEPLDPRSIRVTDMVEKPPQGQEPSNLAIIGRYILTPEVFDTLRQTPLGRGGELQITDALRTLAAQGRVIAYRFQGRRFDCGSLGGFVEATNFFYQRDHLGE
jgi:UTP--glucose-1-phosphate uridylyltransferase